MRRTIRRGSCASLGLMACVACAGEPIAPVRPVVPLSAPALTPPLRLDDPTPFPTARVEAFNVLSIAPSDLWDRKAAGLFDIPPLAVDSEGVPFITWGGGPSRQPVSIATVAILMLSNAAVTGNTVQRDSVEWWAHRVIAETDTTATNISFPYQFEFALHGIPADNEVRPWYSALAQGEWLELLVRLYLLTGRPEYKAWADKIFIQFLDVRPYTQNPYSIAHVDSAGYYWADEYPNNGKSDQTLNGYMYAIRGVYEYWQLTKNENAERVLLAAFTTIKHYEPEWRNPGGISSYCLRHPWVVDGTYHMQVIGLFRDYYRMTGDPFFAQAANDFAADYTQ